MSITKYEAARIPVSVRIEGELRDQDPLLVGQLVAQRLTQAAETGSRHGAVVGVETAMAPSLALCYVVPFLLHFLWGLVLGVLSLVGAFLYGCRWFRRWVMDADKSAVGAPE